MTTGTATRRRNRQRFANRNVSTADGAMIRDFGTSYQLVADPWRIVGYVNRDMKR